MKRFIPAIAVAAGTFAIVLPTGSARAETWWLVAASKPIGSYVSTYITLPMESETQCEAAGNRLVQSAAKGKLNEAQINKIRFECVKGK